MKTTKYLSLAALALMGTLASCQSDDEAAVSFARPANAVGINVSVGSLKGTTRSNPAATDDTQRELNLGDQISVSTDGQDPVLFQCTDADMQTWAEAVSGKFLLWTQSEMTFKAYYPATDGTSMTNFTLPADQSTEAKIAQADYMTGQRTCDNENGTDITLYLERKTARVIVRINDFTDQYDEGQQTVSNVRINSQYSTINDGNGQGDVTAVTPYMQGTGGAGTSYTALVVPGDGDDGADFITLTDGENNTLTVKGFHELREGYSYTYNLTVGKNTIQVQSVTVTDWTGETLAGGQAQEQAAASTPALSLTSPAVGQVIGSDGKNYAYGSLPTGVTAVAKICYVSGSNGLALALTDEEGTKDWSTAQTTCAAHTPAFTGGTWKLASQDEWDNMISTAGSQTDLRDGFSSVGGTNMQQDCYWSSTEKDTDNAWLYYFGNGQGYWNDDEKGYGYYVRACLAF